MSIPGYDEWKTATPDDHDEEPQHDEDAPEGWGETEPRKKPETDPGDFEAPPVQGIEDLPF